MAKKNKDDIKAFTVNFPKTLVEEIDAVCSSEFITRTSWLIRAAKELIKKERLTRTEDLLANIIEREENK
jgi:metal-responsive CopG/Arc/MetJ family transcriptional regulator